MVAAACIVPLAAASVAIADPATDDPSGDPPTEIVTTTSEPGEGGGDTVTTTSGVAPLDPPVGDPALGDPPADGSGTGDPAATDETVETASTTSQPTLDAAPMLALDSAGPMLMTAALGPPAPTCTVSVPVYLGATIGARCLKTRMAELGAYDGPINDEFEWHAAYILGNLQQEFGFVRTSIADKPTLERLGIWLEPTSSTTCTVSVPVYLGSTVGARCVKTRMAELGAYDGPINDEFEWHAAYVLGNLQQSYGLARTSVADRATLERLGIWYEDPATCSVMVEVRLNSTVGARCVETRMRAMGLLDTTPDDTFDWNSAYTLGNYQQSLGMTRTSVGDVATLTALGVWRSPPAASCKIGTELSVGKQSGDVQCLERRLADLGIFGGTPDSTFDEATRLAVVAFQRAKGLPDSGNASSATLMSLGILDAALGNPLPANSGTGRRLVYSRGQQRLWAVDSSGEVVKTHRVSGRTYEPYAGTYSVFSRSLHTYAQNNPSVRWMYMVRFTRGFQGGNIGFHEIPKQNGRPMQTEAQLGLPLSGGCVRQATSDAIWVWNWAPVGTKVVVL